MARFALTLSLGSCLLAMGCPQTDDSGTDDTASDVCLSGSVDGVPPGPVLTPAFRGATTLGLAGARDITTRTGENPTVSTWDGKVLIARCPDPEWPADDYAEPPADGQPGVLSGQYWCFHAFRPTNVTLDGLGTPQFGNAFGPGFTSTDRHVSHSGGFPVVENQSPDARFNPYRSTADGTACGVASLDGTPPPCPAQRYATYDAFIVHSVAGNNPTALTDYPDYPEGQGIPTYFEQMLIVVQDPETPAANVVDVIRDSTPYPMIADPDGYAFVYDQDDDSVRNPYLFRAESAPDGPTYIGGIVTIEPAATNDGRMVIFNGGDENPHGINLIYTWNPDPAASAGWSPPKNLAYMHYVEGPGAPGGETMIEIGGVDVPFSDVFPIAKQPLRDQDGTSYDVGSTYAPGIKNPDGEFPPFVFESDIATEHYMGSYPWISWDGRNVMSLSVGRFNVAVIGDLTNYSLYFIDGGIDRTDFHGDEAHEISAMWNLGQWPGRWAQFGNEFEGWTRTVPTRLRDAATWVIFEQDHYSEISFHKTDGSYALYFPMSRMRHRTLIYDLGTTPDVSGRFNTGTLQHAGGSADFSQLFSDDGYDAESRESPVFGFSGQSVGFLADADDAGVEPHIVADGLADIEGAVAVEGAIYLQTGTGVPANPWATLLRQPDAFALGVDDAQTPWFEVTLEGGERVTLRGEEALPEDTWVHLTGMYYAGAARLYVDAEIVAEQYGDPLPIAPTTGDLYVGPKNDGANAGGHGLVFIDEVGVTPARRTFEEIAHSAHQRITWPTTALSEWESAWGPGSMPLGLVDGAGNPLAPMYLGYDMAGDLEAKKLLGEALFHDGALSTTDPAISCESCHGLTVEDGGARAGEVTSPQGAGPLTRHTPTVYNRLFGRQQFWDGRAAGLADQILFPITSPVEMNMPLDHLQETALPQAGYVPQFCAAFGTNETTIGRLQEAITLYESGLVSGDSLIDRHRLLGETMPEEAERGLALFETKARCIGCHPPPTYADERFHDNAQGNDTDAGRAMATAHESDFGKFRTMSLRDAARTPPYMHDGSVASLQEVVELYNTGGDGLENEMKPLGLSPEEVADVVAFLEALRSEAFVVPLR